ncbi:thermospermine synthase ACAULIS5-like [Cicer arietinum]|uniref:thermospermine synthase n=1 Tax=Cicer arietinum TaxID=3827 RepID=A0A3Q7YAT0_CICAR|nr:thermospermine synthase ACAULIS5-like [Cicer arietinum]
MTNLFLVASLLILLFPPGPENNEEPIPNDLLEEYLDIINAHHAQNAQNQDDQEDEEEEKEDADDIELERIKLSEKFFDEEIDRDIKRILAEHRGEREHKPMEWFEEEIDLEIKRCMAIDRVEFEGSSEIQRLSVIATKRFGKALVIDGLLQTTDLDEFIFHESLVHPALLIHNEPKNVFILGGGRGFAAKEVLKHKSVEKVIQCEIDKEVVNLYREHMTSNFEAFTKDERIQYIFNDAKEELSKYEGLVDVIIGDLCDPDAFSLSMNLYTKDFYESVVKQKLKSDGIFVTQAGAAGIFTHKYVFAPIYYTLKQVFNHVVGYTAHIPSYGDCVGFIMASMQPINIDAEELDNMIGEKIEEELRYLDGHVIAASTVLNKYLKIS